MANSNRSFERLRAPVEKFLAIESASGIVLMVAAMCALAWANSPWQGIYERLWHAVAFEHELHFWINDGLMTIFFFVVGLEIRREIHAGELSELRRAMLPVAAALGGMLAPALLFAAFNNGRVSARGWAVPMATDIAFAVGVLALLGKRVSPALRIFLLALAVIDDVGAILVIALFYSGGIHATLAGVVLGLMTPVSWIERLQRRLHRWVSFGIMPLFAFANAGVPLGTITLAGDEFWSFVGITLGLIVGKPLGILAVSWFAVRIGIAALPVGLQWRHVAVVGMVGGVGFTMALFIAQLAFPAGPLLETAKLAILSGSAAAAVLALFAGYCVLRPRDVHRIR